VRRLLGRALAEEETEQADVVAYVARDGETRGGRLRREAGP
jgi:glutamine phosphoribosylpyrophosphate amidotransferase